MGLFVVGVVMALIGMPYLLGYSTNECLKYPLSRVNGCHYPCNNIQEKVNQWDFNTCCLLYF